MKNDKQEDQRLLARINAGEEPAFQQLFNKYYRFLCIASYKIYADEHKSKDFAQEVFLDLWRKRGELQIHTSLNAYLKKSVVYKTIDHIRARRLNFEEIPDFSVEEPKSQQKLELEELKTLIHETAQQLPERCRIIFFMSRFEELSHKEIAQKLDISPKTVEHQITKALKVLRTVVQPYISNRLIQLIFFLLQIGESAFYLDLIQKHS